MEDSSTLVIPEAAPGAALHPVTSPLIIKKGHYDETVPVRSAFSCVPQASQPADITRPETGVKVFFYVGTPSHRIGQNGDFYLEEITNILYGPKTNGIWPEDGVPVTGSLTRKRPRGSQQAWSVDLDEVRRASRGKNPLLRAISRALSAPLATLLARARKLLVRTESTAGLRAMAAAAATAKWDIGSK